MSNPFRKDPALRLACVPTLLQLKTVCGFARPAAVADRRARLGLSGAAQGARLNDAECNDAARLDAFFAKLRDA